MNAVVIEHVPLADLPLAWRGRLPLAASAQVRVRIEEEDEQPTPFETNDPAFGIWRDREDMADALIAATALEHGHAVLTANIKHFDAVAGLQLEKFVI